MLHPVFRMKSDGLIWIGYVVFVGLSCWIFFGNLVNHPLDTHDADLFEDNIAISADFSHFFSSDKKVAGGRPLTELVRWLTYVAVGNDPKWFHLLGLFFHAFASVLLATFLRRLGATIHFSFAASTLFLVNVTHFQAVHWITGLDYPLALCLGLTGMNFYACYQTSPRRNALFGMFVSVVAAVFAQPSIAVLWFFCVFWSWQNGKSLRSTLRSLLPLALLLALANLIVIRMTFKGFTTWLAIESNATMGILEGIVSAGHLLLWFLSRLITTAHWLPLRVYEHHNWELVAGGIVLASLLLAVLKNVSLLSIWASWILLCVGPFVLLTTDVVFTYGHLLTGGSRFLYFASAGSSVFLAWLMRYVAGTIGRRLNFSQRIFEVVCMAAFLLSSFFALRKVEAISFYSAGRNYIARGDVGRGRLELQRAIRTGSDVIPLKEAYVALIHVTMMMKPGMVDGLLSEARHALPESTELRVFKLVVASIEAPSEKRLMSSRIALEQLKEHEDSRVPGLIAQTYHNLGLGYLTNGEYALALTALDRSLSFQEDRETTRKLRAFAQSRMLNK